LSQAKPCSIAQALQPSPDAEFLSSHSSPASSFPFPHGWVQTDGAPVHTNPGSTRHFALQPSLASTLASSQPPGFASGPTTNPSPHFGEQVLGSVSSQLQCCSTPQLGLQPSLARVFASSQWSAPSSTPLPQVDVPPAPGPLPPMPPAPDPLPPCPLMPPVPPKPPVPAAFAAGPTHVPSTQPCPSKQGEFSEQALTQPWSTHTVPSGQDACVSQAAWASLTQAAPLSVCRQRRPSVQSRSVSQLALQRENRQMGPSLRQSDVDAQATVPSGTSESRTGSLMLNSELQPAQINNRANPSCRSRKYLMRDTDMAGTLLRSA
jgi:hypothetical protein